MKKKTSKPKQNKSSIVDQISESQIRLLHLFNDLNNKLNITQLENNSLHFQMGILKRENYEIKGLMENIGRNMSVLKNMSQNSDWLDDGDDDIGLYSPSSNNKPNNRLSQIKKELPLHDDVMMSCEVCSTIHHINIKTCPKCSFDRSKK